MKNEKAITLIALIITIIVLLILAGITISLTLGEHGILNLAKQAKTKTEEETAREKLELVLLDLQAKKHTDVTYNETDYINKEIEKNNMEVEGDTIFVNGWQFQIDRRIPKIISSQKDTQNKSLIGKITNITTSGYHTIKVTTKTGEETIYNLHVLNYNQDLILDGETQIQGAALNNKTYELGNKETDVATENQNAKNMVALKINGNLTIEEGITLTTCKSDNGYGGPKGMLIYCTGTITNKGTISMTARGAKAEGENIYLWQNEDESFEYIPAVGGAGGN